MTFDEEELLPLSALQHLIFCERQCALIHMERQWKDNRLTLEGSHMHERVHEGAPRRDLRRDVLLARRVALRSFELGVSGVADVVEFRRAAGDAVVPEGARLPSLSGHWIPCPVEYKRGRPKPSLCDEVQLCAQAMCLEEMLSVPVLSASLFYGATQHRHVVAIDDELRSKTREAASRLHALVRSGVTPRARREPKCRSCSLLDVCQPDAMRSRGAAARFLVDAFRSIRDEEAAE